MEKEYLSIGKIAKLLGVHVNTLRRWEKSGKLTCEFITIGNHRRYKISSVVALFSKKEKNRSYTVGYARVSSSDQKEDLARQKNLLSHYCDDVISDIGSGMNFNKKWLNKLIYLIFTGKVTNIVINNKDRLLRFDYELFEKFCHYFNVKITVLNEEKQISFENQLVTDLITIIIVFSSKLYGKRSHKNKKAVLVG